MHRKAEILYFSKIIIMTVCLFHIEFEFHIGEATKGLYFGQKTTNVETDIEFSSSWLRRYLFIPQVLLYNQKPKSYIKLNFGYVRGAQSVLKTAKILSK
jgi:hypothetical protein